MEREIQTEKAFLERIDSLDGYKLSDDEYHLALMLLYYYKTCPAWFLKGALRELLDPEMQSENDVTRTAVWKQYRAAEKLFTSHIGRERLKAGNNDIAFVAKATELDSASNILLRFRQDDFSVILHEAPNLGNVRRVDIEKVAREPGNEYLRFLMEWFNSIA